MSTPHLSVILITHNEAGNIAACLASVAFADERIVVDLGGSTDGTAEIARAAWARTVHVTAADWPGFGAQKNRALALATGRMGLQHRCRRARHARARREHHARVGPRADAHRGRLRSLAAVVELLRPVDAPRRLVHPDRVLRLFKRERRPLLERPGARAVDRRWPHRAGWAANCCTTACRRPRHALDKMNRWQLGPRRRQGRGGRPRRLGFGTGAWVLGLRALLYPAPRLSRRAPGLRGHGGLRPAEGDYYAAISKWAAARAWRSSAIGTNARNQDHASPCLCEQTPQQTLASVNATLLAAASARSWRSQAAGAGAVPGRDLRRRRNSVADRDREVS